MVPRGCDIEASEYWLNDAGKQAEAQAAAASSLERNIVPFRAQSLGMRSTLTRPSMWRVKGIRLKIEVGMMR
jgi:hypothetical protein